jgi:N-acetylglutamate synthase-like GNAT family acetyltransferase
MPIRSATEADLPQLCALIAASVQVNARDDSSSDLAFVIAKNGLESLQRHLVTRDMFVFEQNGRIIGTVSLAGNRLNSLYVDLGSMKGGIGRQLVEHVERLAFSRGVSTLVVSSSRTAVPFYQQLGYTKLNFEPREFAPTWAMEKQL